METSCTARSWSLGLNIPWRIGNDTLTPSAWTTGTSALALDAGGGGDAASVSAMMVLLGEAHAELDVTDAQAAGDLRRRDGLQPDVTGHAGAALLDGVRAAGVEPAAVGERPDHRWVPGDRVQLPGA